MKNYYRLGRFTINDFELHVLETRLAHAPIECELALLKKFNLTQIEDLGTLDYDDAIDFVISFEKDK